MITVVIIVLALEVTFVVANNVPRAPKKPTTLLPTANESTLVSLQTKLVVHLRPSVDEEEITLLAESLDKPILNPTEHFSNGNFPDVLRNFIKKETLLTLPNRVTGKQHGSKGTKAFFGGEKKHTHAKSLSGSISDDIALNPPSHLLDSWSTKCHTEDMDELFEPLQLANVLTSSQRREEQNGDEMLNREKILLPDPVYQPSKVLGNKFKLTSTPESFTRLKQESIVAPLQDYLIEPGDDSVSVQQFDFNLGEVPIPNILPQQAIDALKKESADILKLDSNLFLALECLLPPLDDLKTDQDDMKLSFGPLEESDSEPLKTILHLWESDEDGEHGSDFSRYDEGRRTSDEGGVDNNYDDTT